LSQYDAKDNWLSRYATIPGCHNTVQRLLVTIQESQNPNLITTNNKFFQFQTSWGRRNYESKKEDKTRVKKKREMKGDKKNQIKKVKRQ
jgi:hypothetical protein